MIVGLEMCDVVGCWAVTDLDIASYLGLARLCVVDAARLERVYFGDCSCVRHVTAPIGQWNCAEVLILDVQAPVAGGHVEAGWMIAQSERGVLHQTDLLGRLSAPDETPCSRCI